MIAFLSDQMRSDVDVKPELTIAKHKNLRVFYCRRFFNVVGSPIFWTTFLSTIIKFENMIAPLGYLGTYLKI